MDLAREIDKAVSRQPPLRQKLWENVAGALGVDFAEKLDRKFDIEYARKNIVVFAIHDIPSLQPPEDKRITGIRFRSDLSTVQSSLVGTPFDFLKNQFAIT